MYDFLPAISGLLICVLLIWYFVPRINAFLVKCSKTAGYQRWKILWMLGYGSLMLWFLAILPLVGLWMGWETMGDLVRFNDGNVGMVVYSHWTLSPSMMSCYIYAVPISFAFAIPMLAIIGVADRLASGYVYLPPPKGVLIGWWRPALRNDR